MKKVRIAFNDGSKVIVIAHHATVAEGCLALDLDTAARTHEKLLPLCNLECIDVTPTLATEVSYDKA